MFISKSNSIPTDSSWSPSSSAVAATAANLGKGGTITEKEGDVTKKGAPRMVNYNMSTTLTTCPATDPAQFREKTILR